VKAMRKETSVPSFGAGIGTCDAPSTEHMHEEPETWKSLCGLLEGGGRGDKRALIGVEVKFGTSLGEAAWNKNGWFAYRRVHTDMADRRERLWKR